jgi:SAM-dependent methyltransferase
MGSAYPSLAAAVLDLGRMAHLLLGCGHSRNRRMGTGEWINLVTLDVTENCGADVIHDMERLPLPFEDDSFDEVHAYHVLEHQGSQGDAEFFFAQFSDLWRILRPDGLLNAIVPSRTSPWAWGDPGHRRLIQPETLVFLDQSQYADQVGITAMADYRYLYRADFAPVGMRDTGEEFFFCLRAVKPSRIAAPCPSRLSAI